MVEMELGFSAKAVSVFDPEPSLQPLIFYYFKVLCLWLQVPIETRGVWMPGAGQL